MSLEQFLVNLFSSVPDWLATVLIAMIPITELRGSIPIAIGYYGMSPLEAFFFSVIGNSLPVVPLLLFLEPVSNFLRRWKIWDRFFTWLFGRTHRNHSESFERYGTLALAIFVAIPLPLTGAWSGCAAAFVFGIRFWNALFAVVAGVIIAGILVTLATVGIIGFI